MTRGAPCHPDRGGAPVLPHAKIRGMMTPRAVIGSLLVAGLAYAVPSIRHLDAPDRRFVVDD